VIEETGSCVVCKVPILGNTKVRLPSARLSCCSSCGTWVYFPRSAQNEQAAIHDSADYFDHPYFKLRRTLGPAQIDRCRQIFSRLASATGVEALRGLRILDVGCDTGTFLAAASQEFGVIPVGVDVNVRAVALAAEAGIEAYRGTIEDAPGHLRDFSVITAIDLIEHVSDPQAFLAEIRGRLRPGGLAYIETPNIRSAVYGIGRVLSVVTGGRPAALYERLFPPQHIQYFTGESLAALVRSSALEVVQMGKRALPSTDIAASPVIRAIMSGMQLIDGVTGERILIWAVLRRPVSKEPPVIS
jgi:2-polyprenyl-6-hydroxyphenyl methylase/3-demethylubiquinone-9 3-methyltransferase